MKSSFKMLSVLIAAAALSACASKPQSLYAWGSYPESIYETLSSPEKSDPQKQIKKLESDLQKARTKNQTVAPGFYAHLAHQYLKTGQKTKALDYLQLEKQTYPESTVYIDRLLHIIE